MHIARTNWINATSNNGIGEVKLWLWFCVIYGQQAIIHLFKTSLVFNAVCVDEKNSHFNRYILYSQFNRTKIDIISQLRASIRANMFCSDALKFRFEYFDHRVPLIHKKNNAIIETHNNRLLRRGIVYIVKFVSSFFERISWK